MSKSFAKIDEITGVDIGIQFAHHEVHEGDSFMACAVDLTLASAATLIVAFKTMAGTKRAHMIADFLALVGGHLDIIEGPTWDDQSGALLPIYNRKRLASMTSSGLLEDQAQAGFAASDNLHENPTTLAGGTIIRTIYGFGNKNAFSSAGRDLTEILLKPDTQYAIVFTSDDNSNSAQICLHWYEHTDAN